MKRNRTVFIATLLALVLGSFIPAWSSDLVVTGAVSGSQTYDSPEGMIFDQAALDGTANVTAISTFEVHIRPGTSVANGARLSITIRDNDGLPNRWELQYFGNLDQNPWDDPDGDGLTNLEEYLAGTTSPNNPDSDGDGVPDQCEAPYDTSAPTLTILGSDPVNLCHGETYNDAGATAIDNCLGDITGNMVVSNPVNTSVSGTYIVTYNVQDGAGNSAAQVTRTVYVDVQPPVITLQGENPLVFCPNSTYEDPGASASDNCDGDLSGSITVDNPVDMNQPGNYTVTYNVTDSAGNHAQPVTRTVVVVGGDTKVQVKTTYDYDAIGRLLSISKQVQ